MDLSLFRDESQLKTTKRGNKLKRSTKSSSSKTESTDTEDNPDDEEDEKVPAKQPVAKKLARSKMATIAKTISKGANNRAERAATRSSRTTFPTVDAALFANKKKLNDKKSDTKKIAAKSEINHLNTLPKKPKACSKFATISNT